MLEQQRVIEIIQEDLTQTPGMKAERSRFTVAEDAFLAVLKKKIDILNVSQEIERELREDHDKERKSHEVDVKNVTTHLILTSINRRRRTQS